MWNLLLEEVLNKDDISSVVSSDISKFNVSLFFHVVNDEVVAFFYMLPFDWQ